MADTKKARGVQMTDEEKREKIRRALLVKKECEARAMQIVHKFLEETASEESLKDAANHINQASYSDLVTERSINHTCGYPLCSNQLVNVKKGKYHISLTDKKVYNIEERKKFCSDFCFSASNFYQQQLETAPLWLRESNRIVYIQLLSRNDSSHRSASGKGDIVVEVANQLSDMTMRRRQAANKDTDLASDDKEDEKDTETKRKSTEEMEPVKQSLDTAHIVPTDTNKREPQMPVKLSKVKTRACDETNEVNVLEVVIKNLTEWFTESSGKYLTNLEEDDSNDELDDNADDVIERLEPDREPAPDPDELSALREQSVEYYSKFAAYIVGREAYEEEIKRKKVDDNKGDDDHEPRLPLLDRHAQKSLRVRIVMEGMTRVAPNILQLLRIPLREVRGDLSHLVETFNLTSENIIFKQTGWRLAFIVILVILKRRNESIKQMLSTSESIHIMNTLLQGFGLTLDGIETLYQEKLLKKPR